MGRINVTENDRWIEHCRQLWFQEWEEMSPAIGEPSEVEDVDLDELADTLKETKR